MPGTGYVKIGSMDLFEIETRTTGRIIYSLPYSDLIRKDISEKNLSFAGLRGCDMSFSNFSGSSLTNADFRYCNLTGVNLEQCAVLGCEFDGSNLTGASGLDMLRKDDCGKSGFYRASWKGCDFTGVDLSWVSPDEINNPSDFFRSCKGLPNGFVESLEVRKNGKSVFGM